MAGEVGGGQVAKGMGGKVSRGTESGDLASSPLLFPPQQLRGRI